MSGTNDEIDRREIIRNVLAVGGVAALTGGAAAAATATTPHARAAAVVAEREWARTLARSVADQLPEAARQLPGLGLNADQVEQLKRAFENTLLTNMGCTVPPSST